MRFFFIWEITLLKSVTVLADKYMFATTERLTGFQKNITSVIFLSTLTPHTLVLIHIRLSKIFTKMST